ncbi:hypothetical protein ACVW0Y_004720 [Pseudomonas sp. TE3786]
MVCRTTDFAPFEILGPSLRWDDGVQA